MTDETAAHIATKIGLEPGSKVHQVGREGNEQRGVAGVVADDVVVVVVVVGVVVGGGVVVVIFIFLT